MNMIKKKHQFVRPLPAENENETINEEDSDENEEMDIDENVDVEDIQSVQEDEIDVESSNGSFNDIKINSINLIEAMPLNPTFEQAREIWPNWIQMMKLVFECHPRIQNNDRIKLTILVSKGGDFIQKIILKNIHAICFDEAIELINQYFIDNSNRVADEALFHQLKQREDESFEKFVDNVKAKAKVFNIKDDQRIMLQISYGAIESDKLIDYSIRGNTNLSNIVAYGNQLEALRHIKNKEVSAGVVNYTSSRQDRRYKPYDTKLSGKTLPTTSQSNWIDNCKFCGRSHEIRKCPAFNKTCANCQKRNHFAKVCRSKSNQESKVQMVVCNDKLCIVDILIAGLRVSGLVDSGASVNIINEQIWSELSHLREQNKAQYPISDFKHIKENISVYGGGSVETICTFSALIEVYGVQKPSVYAKVLVVKGAARTIISKDTAEALHLLKVGLEVNQLQLQSIESEEQFPCIPGKVVRLNIDENVTPVQIPRVRIPAALEMPVKERIKQMLACGIIERAPNTNSFVSPMNVVAKGSGDFRIVIDMREANKAIKRKFHPLPIMERIFRLLAGAKWFTTLDLKSAYHQIMLHKDSRAITTFMTPLGAMRFTRLAFGMNAAPEIFQETIDGLLSNCEGTVAYLDDVLIYSKTLEELKMREKKVIETLEANNMLLNKEKCQFEQQSVEFLGFKVDGEGIHPTKDRIQTIESMRAPKDVKELRSLLGCITWLGGFIPDLATTVEPMRRLIRNGEIFEWGVEQESAFKKVKELMKAQLVHAFFDNTLPTLLYTDASAVGLGTVLTQIQNDGQERVVIFASKSLTKTERSYPQVHREALAVVWAMEKFEHYLLGREFTLVTDNSALKQLYGSDIRDSKRTALRFEGWQMRLAPFRFKIKHISGKSNVSADMLSRLCGTEPIPYEEKKEVLELGKVLPQINLITNMDELKTISIKSIQESTSKDEELQAVLKSIQTDRWTPETKFMRAFANEMFEKNGILMRGHQIVMPTNLRKQVLINAHVAHSGVVVMKRSLRSRLWWPRMDRDVTNFVQECLGCTAVSRDDPPEPLERTKLPSSAMEFIAIDHWSSSTLSTKLLVITDYFSRYLWVKPVKDTTSAETIKVCENIFGTFGKPKTLRADNGTAFSSNEFRSWCDSMDIKLDFAVPLWPQHNGQVENAMKLINKTLRIANVNRTNWRSALDAAIQFSNNERVHSTTGVTPAELMFGRKLRGLIPLMSCKPIFDEDDVRERDLLEKDKGKEYADMKRGAKESSLKIGDKVFMRTKHTDKLSANFDVSNPCEVIDKQGATVVIRTQDGHNYERNSSAVKKSNTLLDNESENEKDLAKNHEASPEEGTETTNEPEIRPRRTIRAPEKLSL